MSERKRKNYRNAPGDSDYSAMRAWQDSQTKADLAFQAALRAAGVPEGVSTAESTSVRVSAPRAVTATAQSSIGGNFV